MEEEQKEGEISVKIFPNPPKEKIALYEQQENKTLKAAALITSIIIIILILLSSIYAILKTKNYSAFNMGIIAIIIAIKITLLKILNSTIKKRVHIQEAKITRVRDTTKRLEIVTEKDRRQQKELTIEYETTDKNEKTNSQFVILIEKEDYEKLKPDIPEPGDTIPLIVDKKSHKNIKILEIYIPALKPYIKNY